MTLKLVKNMTLKLVIANFVNGHFLLRWYFGKFPS